MSTKSAEPLILIDPATGTSLSRLQTWLAIAVMLSGTTFVALVVTAVAPIMHRIAEHFGQGTDGKTVAYGVAIMPSIGIMIGGPITGWVIERVGSRNLLLLVLALFGLTGSAGLYLDDIQLLIVTRFILGISAAGIVTGTLIMIGEYFAPEMRIRILGYQGAVGAIAALAIILGSGVLADAAGWRAPFALYLIAFIVFSATLVAVPRRPAGGPAQRAATSGGWSAFAGLWIPLAITVALFVGSFMPTLQVSFLLKDLGVLSSSVQSLVLGASAIMVSLGSAMYGPLRLRVSDRWVLRLCSLSIGAGIVVSGLAHEAIQVAVGCAISGIGTGLLNPQVNNMLLSRVGAEARGRSVGLGYTARYAGDFLNPVIVAPLTLAVGLHGAFIILGGAFVVAAILDAALRRLTPASA
ncbi:MAG TPA: MFS transporter [Alphaproteobacteria bacterium]|nr:MFS transporter [Alphaproteobacteria bacterium]